MELNTPKQNPKTMHSSEDTKKAGSDTDASAKPQSTWQTLSKKVGRIARMMQPDDGSLGTGELAELRRISLERPFTPALWKILISQELESPLTALRQTDWERRWAAQLMGMAYTAGFHDYNRPLGVALAESGWSELRFVQLMRAEEETLEVNLRRMAQYLASKSTQADWSDVLALLLYQEGETGENVRIDIARNYYTTIYKQQQDTSS